MRSLKAAGGLVVLAVWTAPLVGCGDDGNGRVVVRGAEDTLVAASPPPGARPLPGGVTGAMAAEGRRLFSETCVVCHGPDARGTQLGPSLVDDEWIHVSGEYGEILRLIREGVPEPEEHPVPMPPLGGGAYTEAEVRALAAYVYSLDR